MEVFSTNNQKLVNFFNETIVIISENKKIKNINDFACKLLGYNRDKLIGSSIEKIISKEEIFNDIDLNHCNLKLLITNNGEKVSINIKEMVLNDNDENKEVLYYSNNCSNYSGYVNEFINRNGYFDEIFNNVHFAMVIIDNEGNISYTNNAFIKLLGIKKEKVISKQIYELISSNNSKNEIIENIKKVLYGDKLVTEVIHNNKEGKILNLLCFAAPIIINKKQYGANVVFHDITKQKQTQKKLEKANIEIKDATAKLVHTERMTALGELTSSIAHELNQPLNNIKLVCQDILRDIDKDRLDITTIPESIQDVEGQVNKMAKIIDHMRIFTRRLDSTMKVDKIDINDPINNMFLLIGEQLKVRNIEVIKELDCHLPKVLGNTTALEQVFTNILVNARQALEDLDKKDKKIEIKSYMNDENEITVSISNSGLRIPQDVKDKIFEPFFTTKEPGRGTGLGLSISRKIVDEHNGRLELFEKDNWTTFTITLPT